MSDQSEFGKWFQKATKENDPLEEVEYTDWKIIAKGAPRYEVSVVGGGCTVGSAGWTRIMRVKERRYKIIKRFFGEKKEERIPETRTRDKVDYMNARVYMWSTGQIGQPGMWCSDNPWTGVTFCKDI